MQSGVPNKVEIGATIARDLIAVNNANGNTEQQGSPLTPGNTVSAAVHAAPQVVENTQLNPAPSVAQDGGLEQQLTPANTLGNTPIIGQDTPQIQNSIVETTPTQSDIVLAGKYRKEVPAFNRTIKMHESTIEILQSKNANLEKDIQDLQNSLATAAPNGDQLKDGASVPSDPKSLMDALNPDDFTIYGKDFVNLATIMKDSFAQIQTQPQAPPQIQGQTPDRSPEQKAYDNILFAAIGENTFHDINSDSRFVNGFLNQVNPETSRYYRSDLMESHEDMDSATVIRIFKAFIDSLGGQYTPYVQPQQNITQNHGDMTQNQQFTPNLNPAQPPGNINNVSPTPNMSASAPLTPNMSNTSEETFTQQQVDSFYKSITPGVGEFSGQQHAEWAKNMKTRVLSAYTSGRVFKNIH